MSSKGMMTSLIDVNQQKARSAAANKELLAAVSSGNANAAMWMAIVLPADLRKEVAAAASGHSIHAFMASINLQNGVGLALDLATSSAKGASAIEMLLKAARNELLQEPTLQALGLVKMIQNMTVAVKGSNLSIGLQASAAELRSLLQVLSAAP